MGCTIQKASGAQIGHRWLIFNCHLLNSERATPVYEARWTSVGEQRALPLIVRSHHFFSIWPLFANDLHQVRLISLASLRGDECALFHAIMGLHCVERVKMVTPQPPSPTPQGRDFSKSVSEWSCTLRKIASNNK